jgi:hypothetical protein
MAKKEMIVFGTDLNKILKEEALAIVPVKKEALALVPIKEEAIWPSPLSQMLKPLAIVPPKALATVPPTQSYEQAYYAQVCRPTLPSPPTKLFLKDASKDKKVIVPQGTKVLPPKDNERVDNVKTNKFRDVTYVKYATISCVSLDDIRAPPGQVYFLPPQEAPKRSTPPPLFKREARRPKTTIAILEERFQVFVSPAYDNEKHDSADRD